jgi:hypothetical protein
VDVKGCILVLLKSHLRASDVRARLSLKATAWARLSRAHSSSDGQAEPEPSRGLSLGLASAWATAFKAVFEFCV